MAPNKLELSYSERDSSGQPKVKSKHYKNQGLEAGYPINNPRNAFTLIMMHLRGLRVWAGDMSKNVSGPIDLDTKLNMVVHYIETYFDRHPHFRFETGFRFDNDAANKVSETQIQASRDLADRKEKLTPHIVKSPQGAFRLH